MGGRLWGLLLTVEQETTMSQFMKPVQGNKDRPGSPVNSAKNLQRKLNRQARAKKAEEAAQ